MPLQLELGGRLRNIGKPKYWYMAIAEAIKNSMDAVEDAHERFQRHGCVEVILERTGDLASVGCSSPVRHVTVKDNGVGFDEPNFSSFCRPDSLYKQSRGGKGVARLVCIQAFHQMQVTSYCEDKRTWKKRDFVFQQEAPELAQHLTTNGQASWLTEVKLMDLRDDYEPSAAIAFQPLIDWLVEHFLPALLEKPVWLQSLVIRDGREETDLTQLVNGGALWRETFKVKNYDFFAGCYTLKSCVKPDMVRLVAGGRVVDANTRTLEHYVPHLQRVSDSSTHVILVHSPFFDEHINDARNGVSFCEDEEGNALLGITAAQFRLGLSTALRSPLHQHIDKSVEELRQRVKDVVQQEAPYYQPLLLGYFESKDFSELAKSARTEEILTSIDGYKRRTAGNLKRESKRLAKISTDNADYYESARKLASQVEMQKKMALAEYVSLRRIVLQHLEDLLRAKPDGKAPKEEEIHNLIFPQKTDTESNPGIDHQLWILDERLESHNYLASDKAMDGAKGDRPDLLIALDNPGSVALDRPGAFASDPYSKSRGYERIVLVEFKRTLQDLAVTGRFKRDHLGSKWAV